MSGLIHKIEEKIHRRGDKKEVENAHQEPQKKKLMDRMKDKIRHGNEKMKSKLKKKKKKDDKEQKQEDGEGQCEDESSNDDDGGSD